MKLKISYISVDISGYNRLSIADIIFSAYRYLYYSFSNCSSARLCHLCIEADFNYAVEASNAN